MRMKMLSNGSRHTPYVLVYQQHVASCILPSFDAPSQLLNRSAVHCSRRVPLLQLLLLMLMLVAVLRLQLQRLRRLLLLLFVDIAVQLLLLLFRSHFVGVLVHKHVVMLLFSQSVGWLS